MKQFNVLRNVFLLGVASLVLFFFSCNTAQKDSEKDAQLTLKTLTIHGKDAKSGQVTVDNSKMTVEAKDVEANFTYGNPAKNLSKPTIVVKGGKVTLQEGKPVDVELSVPAVKGKYDAWKQVIKVTRATKPQGDEGCTVAVSVDPSDKGTLTVTAAEDVTGAITATTKIKSGKKVTLKLVVSATDYAFDAWETTPATLQVTKGTAEGEYTFSMPSENVTVKAKLKTKGSTTPTGKKVTYKVVGSNGNPVEATVAVIKATKKIGTGNATEFASEAEVEKDAALEFTVEIKDSKTYTVEWTGATAKSDNDKVATATMGDADITVTAKITKK